MKLNTYTVKKTRASRLHEVREYVEAEGVESLPPQQYQQVISY